MELYIAGLLGLFIVVLAVLLWMGYGVVQKESESLRHEMNEVITNNMALVNQQLGQVTSQVAEQLTAVTSQIQNSTGQINDRMDNAARVVGEVSRSLGELDKATEQVFEVGKDIAGLQEILRAPKLRGEMGEFFLGDLLSQILPSSHFELQYAFKDGTKVDAVIKFANGLVPVDSKFPLENFKRILEGTTEDEKKAAKRKFISDVKNRIDELASSYIVPDEGTFNFALMYIPAENVYYETIIKDEAFGDEKQIAAYAFSKRVIPVSPNSFYAYLQTIVLGLRGLEISRQARAILTHLETLKNDFDKFTDDFDVIGGHITKTKNKFDEAQKKIERFGEKLTGLGLVETEKLEEPEEKGLTS
jgi:DNA recombination protein RmuC